MDKSKLAGQNAVDRILDIRKAFSKASTKVKVELNEEFKTQLVKLVAYLRVETNAEIVQNIKAKLPDLEQELKNMRQITAEEQKNQQSQKNEQPTHNATEKKGEMETQLEGAILRERPNISWNDVAGLDQAKKVLQEAVILPIKFPEVFVGMRTPWRGILMYGPPGTGKTFLAKACVTQMKGGTFFSISASDLMSKYVGESEKTLKTLFQMARKQKPSIIFIDEIDSIAGARSAEENEVSRRVKTEFLVQMQGVGNDCRDVLVLGATNLPWALDSAVRRRFEKRVYIPLPDIKGRLAMLKLAAIKNSINLATQELHQLGQLTEGYSGSDISNMVNAALMAPLKSLERTKTWRKIIHEGKVKYVPVNEYEQRNPQETYVEGGAYDMKAKGFMIMLQTRHKDFVEAMKSSKPSVSNQDLGRYIEFTKSFGMDG